MHKRGGSLLKFYLVQWLFSQEIILSPFYFLHSRITKYRHSAISNGSAPPPALTACVHISQFKLTRRTVRVGEWETMSERERGRGSAGTSSHPAQLAIFVSSSVYIKFSATPRNVVFIKCNKMYFIYILYFFFMFFSLALQRIIAARVRFELKFC